jgi:hypothetical protein
MNSSSLNKRINKKVYLKHLNLLKKEAVKR